MSQFDYTNANPAGKTQRRWFVVGYQEAMRDIAARLEEGGEEAVRQWVKDNTLAAPRK